MNFADALREAARLEGQPQPPVKVEPKVPPVFQKAMAEQARELELKVVEPAPRTEKAAPRRRKDDAPGTETGPSADNVVRLELLLTPEQISGLFRAMAGQQHSVMTLREAAQYLRVSTSALESMAEQGEIPAILIDGRWRFSRNTVEEWLKEQSFRKEMEA